jgi:hypothetical protein
MGKLFVVTVQLLSVNYAEHLKTKNKLIPVIIIKKKKKNLDCVSLKEYVYSCIVDLAVK